MRFHRLIPPFIEQQVCLGKSADSLPGVVLFVDLSGFSSLTDALMQHGRYGAEVLAKVVRAVFEGTMRAVYEQGGFVFSQEGDAFTALFFDEKDCMQRAVAAALGIQKAVTALGHQSTEFGEFTLQVRIGLSAGQVSWAIAASTDGRRAAFYFYGPPVDASAEAQTHAPANGIVLDASTYTHMLAACQDLLDGQRMLDEPDNFFLLRQGLAVLPEPVDALLPALDLDLA